MQLAENPFSILGATTRDDRRRIMELAEERALITDEECVRAAMAVLTNPRRRLTAELAWLPGLGPKRIKELLDLLRNRPADALVQEGLPPLARANVLADGLMLSAESLSYDATARWILVLARVHEEIASEPAVTLVNEDRSIAGFPVVAEASQADEELQNRRQFYKRTIRDVLDMMAPSTLVRVVTEAVELATDNGTKHAPILIDDLVDSYEVEAQDFLEKESGNISAMVSRIRALADRGCEGSAFDGPMEKLEAVVRNWDRVAQPIQLSCRTRGLAHEHSQAVANELRSLAVDLVNDHVLIEVGQRLTDLRKEVFAELDRVVEETDEDSSALAELSEQRAAMLEQAKDQVESWKEEVTFETDVGALFKSKLRISPDGIEWKGRRISLENITAVRWGATKHSVNFVPTGTTYQIQFSTRSGTVRIELRTDWKFTKFVDCLWRAVGVRLLTEMLQGLRDGKQYRFGVALVADLGIELERRRVFGTNERVPCKWTELVIGNGPGTFYIAKHDEKKVAVYLPYQDMDNVHILEAAIRAFWKRGGAKLSDLLN